MNYKTQDEILWPIISCDKFLYDTTLKDPLYRWGFKSSKFFDRLLSNYSKEKPYYLSIEDGEISIKSAEFYKNEFLCYDSEVFLSMANKISVEKGWYKEYEYIEKKEQENKLNPCVYCSEKMYNEVVRDKLLSWGFKDLNGDLCDKYAILCTECTEQDLFYGYFTFFYTIFEDKGEYLCSDIDTFLENCHTIAIKNGWIKFEETMEKKINTEKKYPCFLKANDKVREIISKELEKLGFVYNKDSYGKFIKVRGFDDIVLNYWGGSNCLDDNEYLCYHMDEFIARCKEIAIEGGWYRETRWEKIKKKVKELW